MRQTYDRTTFLSEMRRLQENVWREHDNDYYSFETRLSHIENFIRRVEPIIKTLELITPPDTSN